MQLKIYAIARLVSMEEHAPKEQRILTFVCAEIATSDKIAKKVGVKYN